MPRVAEGLRRALPPGMAHQARRLSRLRWAAKTRQVRHYGVRPHARRVDVLRYVLTDPEVGDFSYDLRNEDQFLAGVAKALDVPEARVRQLVAEIGADPVLTTELARRVRWRPEMKRRVGFGPRIAWYAAVRERKPELVVETGVKHGFGALLLLQALERNAREGVDGRLISVDLDPYAGWAVPPERRGRWDLVIGYSPDAVVPALRDDEIDMLIHDTPPIPEVERAEYELALARGADTVLLVNGSNGEQTGVLRSIAREHGAEYHLVREEADHPVYPGTGCAFALIERGEQAA
jgi:hypothetical protein